MNQTEIINMLMLWKKELVYAQRLASEELKQTPEGKLICKKKGNSFFYYAKFEADDKRKYIGKKNTKLAAKLAAIDYDKKLLKELNRQIKCIDIFLRTFDCNAPSETYNKLFEGRRRLIANKIPTIAERAAEWDASPQPVYNAYEHHLVFETDKGHMVRSKTELIICNKLFANAIPYKYEMPLYLDDHGREVTFHPDITIFSLADGELYYWEHFGLMNDSEYVDSLVRKIRIYTENGIHLNNNLIATFENDSNPVSIKLIDETIERFLPQ